MKKLFLTLGIVAFGFASDNQMLTVEKETQD